jgi:hypothetical protein
MPYNSRTNKGTPMITDQQILELAKTCECEAFAIIQERNVERDGVCYQFWEEQLIKFAREIRKNGYESGYACGYTDGEGYYAYNPVEDDQ